jgi:excisionase family DNA binding protein
MSVAPNSNLPEPPAPATYDSPDVARVLGVSLRNVRRMDARRAIPGRMTIGRLIRYRRDAVDQWVAAGCPMPRRARGAA